MIWFLVGVFGTLLFVWIYLRIVGRMVFGDMSHFDKAILKAWRR